MPLPFQSLLAGGIAGGDYGQRLNGTQKGGGYFGPLMRPDGNESTELSFDFDHGGKSILAPLLVPTLTRQEIEHLLADGVPTPAMYDKAQQYAIERAQRGMPTFALPNEIYHLPIK